MIGITKFLEELDKAKNRQEYIQKHITTQYLPLELKTALCQKILDASMYKEVNGKKIFWANTPVRYFLFTQMIIRQYTDIDLTDGSDEEGALTVGMNKVEETGIMNEIIPLIGADFNRINTVMQMMYDDENANHTMQNWLDTKIEAVNTVVETIASGVWEQIKDDPSVMELLELLGAQTK